MTKIEILGTGCAKCKMVEKNVGRAVKELVVDAEIIKVENIEDIIERGIMMTPALFIDGEAKVVGKVATVDEIKELLRKGGEEK